MPMPYTPLSGVLHELRFDAATNRESGTAFEDLTVAFLRTEPADKDFYREAVPYAVWAEREGIDKRDVGIDLVAEAADGEYRAIPRFSRLASSQGEARRRWDGQGQDLRALHEYFVVRDIPLGANEYVVNGKPAIEWVMERQSVTTDKDSGIVKDANAWAIETVGDARYPLSLLLRVITVSLETVRIVAALPALEIHEAG